MSQELCTASFHSAPTPVTASSAPYISWGDLMYSSSVSWRMRFGSSNVRPEAMAISTSCALASSRFT
jgi:hypothetical protein